MFEKVAPLVGAWIEISVVVFSTACTFVAPLVGAWIEILVLSYCVTKQRRSSRGSVDWNYNVNPSLTCAACRSSRGSVDWNTFFQIVKCCNVVAPLVGAWIEIEISSQAATAFESLLSWERGLKFLNRSYSWTSAVSLLSWERGLKSLWRYALMAWSGRSSRGSVDWNCCQIGCDNAGYCRSSRGSVDWNQFVGTKKKVKYVAPLVGAWIEI